MLLDANMARDHLAMLGTDITLSATIKGVPTPNVSWKKNNAALPAHVTVAITSTGSKILIPKCVRSDSGNYTLTVENAAGKKTATVAVLVLSESRTAIFVIEMLFSSSFLSPQFAQHFLSSNSSPTPFQTNQRLRETCWSPR